MSYITKKISCVDEAYPGDKWVEFFHETKERYRDWFLNKGDSNRPSLEECRSALQIHMPEFVPVWEDLLRLSNADDELARMLSLYCPAPTKRGCTQAAWTRYNPILVRNYDYDPNIFEGRIQKSRWFENSVISTTDCLWGALDGINQYGLSVSLAYGGSSEVTRGFSITLVLRYVLEFCKSTFEAIEVLKKIPVNMAYNITCLDAWYNVATIQLSPFERPRITTCPFAVNHQGAFSVGSYSIFSNSLEREQVMSELLFDQLVSIESFIAAFAFEPIFSTDYKNSFGTLYTGIYNPYLRASEYRFPGDIRIYQSFEQFIESSFFVSYKKG